MSYISVTAQLVMLKLYTQVQLMAEQKQLKFYDDFPLSFRKMPSLILRIKSSQLSCGW